MRIFNNLMHSLTLLSLLAVCIPTSWSADIQSTENLLRGIFRENPDPAAGISNSNPLPSTFQQPTKISDERISDLIAENVLHFAHTLSLQLAASDPNYEKSEIFSPLSIMAALSLLTLGAKGTSYQELKQLLGIDSDSELIQNPSKYHEEFGLMLDDLQRFNVVTGGISKRRNALWRDTKLRSAPVRQTGAEKPVVHPVIRVANGIFVQGGYTLNPDYSQVLQSVYATQLHQLDFHTKNYEARNYINDWVNKATFGKIPEVVSGDIDKSTNIILASAVYFKALWETSFLNKATFEENFFPDGVKNAPIRIKMMPTGGIFPFYDAKEYDCRIIGLPYKGNETTMYVIQPNNSNRQKLRELQSILTAHKINKMIDNMERKTTVMVFPKMHFTRSMTLKSLLQNMNINDIFINGYSDLSLIGAMPGKSYSPPPPTPPRKPILLPTPARLPILAQAPTPAPARVPLTAQTSHSAPLPESILHQIFSSKQHNRHPVTLDHLKNIKTTVLNDPSIKPIVLDRFNEPGLIFTSRFGEMGETTNNSNMNFTNISPTEPYTTREKRQVPIFNSVPATQALFNLEADRLKTNTYHSDLYVDEIVHKVDFSVDEQGTEAAAATLTYLHRSGTDVTFRGDTPFLILIRHDPTKLPLFYGVINKPEL